MTADSELGDRPHPALPISARTDPDGVLTVGGCRVPELAQRFGTPLYVYDVRTIHASIDAFLSALGPAGTVHYAGKAYLAGWLLRLIAARGIGLDACSGTELEMALAAGFPPERIHLHGNNKGEQVLRQAVRSGIGAIVVDNLPELRTLIEVAGAEEWPAPIMLRVNPGIEAHTHRYLQTGIANSKFGLPIGNGEAEEAVALALAHPRQLRLLGYHAHVGTQILDAAPYGLLTRTLLEFAERMRVQHAFWPSRISPGGGAGITYTDEAALDPAQWIKAVLREADAVRDLAVPYIDIEPGRAIVGRAGMAVYTIGYVKRTDGGRTYVVIDGGMADNIRPALYQARYVALAATRMREAHREQVTVAGPYCESGDILIEEALLPTVLPGEYLVVPATGGYCLSMSSNYNGALRPAVVVVEDGEARLVQRRQTVADLLAIEHA